MAYSGHHERQDTDPIPLRRVVRQRPLTDEELDAIYGRERYERVQQPAPAMRRPDRSPYIESNSPHLDTRPYADNRQYVEAPAWDSPRRERVYSDEVVEIPMRRSRWGFVVVGPVVLAALALLGYALVERSNLLPRALVFGEPEVVFISAEPIADREPLDVSHLQSPRFEASSEPNRGLGLEQAEAGAPAPAAKRVQARPQRRWAPAPKPAAPAAAETPYPSLDPPPVSELEQPAPESAPAPAQEESDGIVSDPGF
jgi:hypothetical protein